MTRTPLRSAALLLGGLSLAALAVARPDPSSVRELRTQKVGDITYFHVRLNSPADLIEAEPDRRGWLAPPTASLAPRLVGEGLRLVCQRQGGERFRPDDIDEKRMEKKIEGKIEERGQPRPPVPVDGLEFVGRVESSGQVKAKLVYAVASKRPRVFNRLMTRQPAPVWREVEVLLDFASAKAVVAPAEATARAAKRDPRLKDVALQPPVRDDLEGLWAVAQADQFAGLASEVNEFGFYSFAESATARKYGVFGQGMMRFRSWDDRPGRRIANSELYETTTGAAAIAESLQMRRMNSVARRPDDDDKRTVAISKLKGIDIAEHPWKEMMGDKKPAPEAFARMVPHDNYYVHFKRIARFLDFNELLDQWGTNLTRAYEVTSRDNRLKERYQQQLCLKSTILGKTLGPLVIGGVCVTGNDAYVREGSDLAVLFQLKQPKLFFAAVEPFLKEAREKFGDRLEQGKAEYHRVSIESYRTPLREVSLYRATLGDVVIYANSPAGVRRIIDAHQGRGKRLADSLDFQYMRTVFRYDDKDEDGFAFLSDAFIRNLVGPASKIKERRRLEALTSLHMMTNAAMFAGWESGKAPASEAALLEASGLTRYELPMPEGNPARWDAKLQVAHSDAYNTLHFATPLIELPMDNVTRNEAEEYERFRLEYLGLWRQFFDPIGIRVSLKEDQVKLDTYILPLIQNSTYNQLRRVTGEKSVKFDPTTIGSKTLGQYLIRLSGDANDRRGWLGGLGPRGGDSPLLALVWAALDPIGDWVLVRFDDGAAYEPLLRMSERAERGENVDLDESLRAIWSLPVAVAADIRNPLVFAGTLAALRTSVLSSLPGAVTWEPLENPYNGVSIVRVGVTKQGREMLDRGDAKRAPFLPAVYYAMIDGAFHLTLNEEMMKSLIDQAKAKRDGKAVVEVASSLYLAPKAAVQTRGLLRSLLEVQTRHQARSSLPIWHALYRSGAVPAGATPEEAREAAYRFLGYVPVSPDGSGYKFDAAYQEVVNERHGSLRRPTAHKMTADDSPVNFLLDQLRSVRADLRFREDGIHTVVTVERGKAAK